MSQILTAYPYPYPYSYHIHIHIHIQIYISHPCPRLSVAELGSQFQIEKFFSSSLRLGRVLLRLRMSSSSLISLFMSRSFASSQLSFSSGTCSLSCASSSSRCRFVSADSVLGFSPCLVIPLHLVFLLRLAFLSMSGFPLCLPGFLSSGSCP
jgi:hypothetical protein